MKKLPTNSTEWWENLAKTSMINPKADSGLLYSIGQGLLVGNPKLAKACIDEAIKRRVTIHKSPK